MQTNIKAFIIIAMWVIYGSVWAMLASYSKLTYMALEQERLFIGTALLLISLYIGFIL